LKHTIKKREDFTRIRDHGFKVQTKSLTVQFLEDKKEEGHQDPASFFRYGLIVTKKMGNAAERNFLKRRIRACVLKGIKDYKDTNNILNIVILPRRELFTADFTKVLSDFSYAIKKFEQKHKG
jgi:ribonuclease P protein component